MRASLPLIPLALQGIVTVHDFLFFFFHDKFMDQNALHNGRHVDISNNINAFHLMISLLFTSLFFLAVKP